MKDKTTKRREAAERQKEYDKLTPGQKIAKAIRAPGANGKQLLRMFDKEL